MPTKTINQHASHRLAEMVLKMPHVQKALANYEANKFADVDYRDAGLLARGVVSNAPPLPTLSQMCEIFGWTAKTLRHVLTQRRAQLLSSLQTIRRRQLKTFRGRTDDQICGLIHQINAVLSPQ